MKKPLKVLAGLMAFGLAGAGSASAQGVYFNGPSFYGPRYSYGPRYYEGGLAPWQIMRVVRSAGLTTVGAPFRRGRTYVVTAIRRDGNQVRVVVDAYRGMIMSVRPVIALRQYRGPVPPSNPRVSAVPPEYQEEAAVPERTLGSHASAPGVGRAPLPPRPAPSQRVANAPAATGSITVLPSQTRRTPIPRPRPQVAANETPAAKASTPAQAPAASPPAAATTPAEVPEAPPMPKRTRPPTQMVPVAPLD